LCPFLLDTYLQYDGGRGPDRHVILQALAWAPKRYSKPPIQGIFGVVHRSGWKGIGVLYAEGKLKGDFGSNEKPELSDWYVASADRPSRSRSAPDPCGSRPRYYFMADDLLSKLGRWAVSPSDLAGYAEIGRVELPNGKGVTIYNRGAAGPEIGRVDEVALSRRFDAQAIPALFAEGPQPNRKVDADFGGLIRLAGYDASQAEGSMALTLFWEAAQAPRDVYRVFVHIEGGLGGTGPAGVWGQSDGVPGCGVSPTESWSPGDEIVDRHVISPAPEASAGSYSLIVGLYRLDTGERLPVLDEKGNVIGDSVTLETVLLPLQ
jgi:hypothetical protein